MEVDSTLRALMTDPEPQWPENSTESDGAQFVEYAFHQGVAGLAYQKLRQSASGSRWPDSVHKRLRDLARIDSVHDAIQERRLTEVLSAFVQEQISPLLMKGAALAYTFYPQSILRPRKDMDLLIRKNDLPKAAEVLHRLGYESNSRSNLSAESLVSHQTLFRKKDVDEFQILIDVHWKISNPVPFSDVLTYEELINRSIPVPALGDNARALSLVDSLLLACIHLVAHHYDEERLIWLFDISLLAGKLQQSEWEEFQSQAKQKQVSTICSAMIAKAEDYFGKSFSIQTADLRAEVPEPSALYLNPDRDQLEMLKIDLKQLKGRKKLALIFEHLFPSPGFMMKKYSLTSKIWLPYFYIYRLISGLHRWLPSKKTSSEKV